jgi:glyoxylase-like metal-dependent hydrolase (beta-lactamase superfamily II)
MRPTLEDGFTNVLVKAMCGLWMTDAMLAGRTGFTLESIAALRGGAWDRTVGRAVAVELGLNADALCLLAEGGVVPGSISLNGLEMYSTPFEDMLVNNFLVWDSLSGEAAAFDSGADCSPLLDALETHSLVLKAVFLTHTHGDHVFEIDRLCSKTGAAAYVNALEPISGAHTFAAGEEWAIGSLRIASRLTAGHSKGGTTFVVRGLERPVAAVGDALFAGSMGGGMVSYAEALRTNRSEIFTLPEETVLCPGHGPLTTVAWEKRWNPFYLP